MKLLLVFGALLFWITGYCQSGTNDTAASCIARWRKGESKTYLVTHEKTTGGSSAPFRFLYEAHISVIDSSDKEYVIKWVYQLPEQYKRLHPHLADSLITYNGLPMMLRVSEMGAFIELLNWEEVRDAYMKQLELSLPSKRDSAMAASLKMATEMFASKQAVESILIKEIQLFHTPFGFRFTTRAATATTELSNPFGGDPFPARQTYQITAIDRTKDAFTLAIDLRVDKAMLSNIIDPMLKKMNLKDDAEMNEIRTQLKTYDLHDSSEYEFVASTGWLRRLASTRSVSAGSIKQSETYTFQLLE